VTRTWFRGALEIICCPLKRLHGYFRLKRLAQVHPSFTRQCCRESQRGEPYCSEVVIVTR
jgi:hypothetical protein